MAKITEVCEVTRSKLKPYERNAKIHSEEQVQKIADSISEFGFVSPCLIDRDYNIIACEQLNRKCYMMELDPHYCDVIIERWEQFTGEKAVKL